MKKNTYIAVLVIVVLGIILWVFLASKKEQTQTPTETPESVAATVSTLSVTNITSPASAVLVGAKTISWQTASYPSDAGVNINLIRKTSDSPIQFDLVRTLETNTPNDGEQSWTPQAGENTNDLYVEVTCSSEYQFQAGCSLSSEPIKVN